jgi:hypothetical protein
MNTMLDLRQFQAAQAFGEWINLNQIHVVPMQADVRISMAWAGIV